MLRGITMAAQREPVCWDNKSCVPTTWESGSHTPLANGVFEMHRKQTTKLYIVLHVQKDRSEMHKLVTGLKQQCNEVCKSVLNRQLKRLTWWKYKENTSRYGNSHLCFFESYGQPQWTRSALRSPRGADQKGGVKRRKSVGKCPTLQLVRAVYDASRTHHKSL